MRLKTQFIITMLLFGIVLAVIAASAIITNQQAEKVGEQERITVDIAQGASELGYLANDYLIYRESQQLKRWQSRFASFSEQVASLHVDMPDQQALVANIQANQSRMKEVFDSTVSAVGNLSTKRNTALDQAFLQVSWSRMAVQSQGLIADASRLSQLLSQQEDQLINARTTLIYVLVGLFGVFLIVSYMLTYRRILESIETLRAGTAVIGSGNLDFIIEERKNDEIGELSRAFNRMTTDLKAITASKTDLEREITERKQAEQALAEYTQKLEEANKELESFSYSVSHDLRAPLRAVDGYARMILKKQGDKFDEDTIRKFNDIRLNTQMMGRLIDDLLAFSRLSRKDMSTSELNMVDLIRDVWKELNNINPDRKMNLIVKNTPLGYGDGALVRQVYFNLLSNAVKFTKLQDCAHIEVGGYNEGNEDAFYVKDNGVGFDMKYYDKLFGVFQRLHNNPDFEGTGVGLAIVQRIVHRHGGRVWAEGKIGEGATFYFLLPRS